MLFDSWKVIHSWSQERAVVTTREELKENAGIEEFKNLITQGWLRTEKDWTKKRELGMLILNIWSNNTQLLTNSGASSKRFILFKLFIPKSKSINLAFLLNNWLLLPN